MLQAARASKTVYSAKNRRKKIFTHKKPSTKEIKNTQQFHLLKYQEREKNIKNHFSVDPEETFLRARKFYSKLFSSFFRIQQLPQSSVTFFKTVALGDFQISFFCVLRAKVFVTLD